MGVAEKARAVEKIFDKLDKKIDQFKATTGLKCLEGCGNCCKKPDIEASILEFLPLAVHLYKQGKAESILDQLENKEVSDICILFTPVIAGSPAGFCSQYRHRGLICRLFGFSATKDKNGALIIATCKRIKEAMPEIFQRASQDVKNSTSIPIITNYYSQLQAIDLNLSEKMMPINQAIRLAIETVALYYYYNNLKAS